METGGPTATGEDLREVAVKQIKKRRDFRSHLVVYFAINAFLWAIWLVVGIADEFSFPWPVFVTVGWGLGVLINAWDVYGRSPTISEQEVEAEMQRLQQGR